MEWCTWQRWPGQEGRDGTAGRNTACQGGSQDAAKFMGEGDFVAAGREGGEARAAVGDGVGWRLEMSLCPLM